MPRHELTCGEGESGKRLDVVLAGIAGSRAKAQRWIEGGHVTVDGEPARKRHLVAAGERIVCSPPDEPRAPDDAQAAGIVPVVFEDDTLLVVDKPAGLVVHPAPGHRSGTLVQLLAGRVAGGDEGWRAGLVHRLDQDTSGLLVLGKSDAAHTALKRQLQDRTMGRTYTALVEGRPPARSGTIDAPIGRDRCVRTRHSTDTATPREARTHFVIREAFDRHTLLDVTLETGRTHQIRVHLQAIGHPVAGDPVYGHAGVLGLRRQFLHAARLQFTHPDSGAQLDFLSELPADLAAALERARSHSRPG